jgi:hypothetical protein
MNGFQNVGDLVVGDLVLDRKVLDDIQKFVGSVKGFSQIATTLGETVRQKVSGRLQSMGITGPDKLVIPTVSKTGRTGRTPQEVAKANQQFYLEFEECDSTTECKPWIHFPKTDEIYGELVFVTPRMALTILSRYNIQNRNKIRKQLEKYTRDMLDGNWYETGESVQFDIYGWLFDGQHRLYAILCAAIAAQAAGTLFEGAALFCVWNVPPEARLVTDSGSNRSEATKIEFIFGDDVAIPRSSRVRQFFAICRSLIMGIKDRRNVVLSHSELAFFGDKYGTVIGQVMQDLGGLAHAHGIKRADVIAALAKSYLWYGREKIFPFADRLGHIRFEGETDPAYLLYKLVKGNKADGVVLYRKTLSAVEYFLGGNNIKKLRETNDLFEWEKEWALPFDAVGWER